MPYYDIITLIGFGFGAALSFMLFSLSLQRVPKRSIDIAFGILFLCFIFWFGGTFLAILTDLLFGTFAYTSIKVFLSLAYLGLMVTPSALLHIQLASLLSARQIEFRLPIKYRVVIFVFYFPALIFLSAYASRIITLATIHPGESQVVSTPFTIWMILAITASIAFSEKLVNTLRFAADRRFYRDISYVLAAIGLGIIVVYIFSFSKLPFIGPWLDLFMLLSPAIPMAVFLYYVYRYNFYRLVIKPSLVYSLIYGSIMAIYLIGIRRFAEYLKQFPDVNAELIEGLLLIALVFVFQPFRTMLQRRLDKLFFKDRYYYQQFLREMSDSISGIVDLETLLQNIRDALVSTLKVKKCTIVIFQNDNDGLAILKSSGSTSFTNLKALVDALDATRHFRLRRQSRDLRVTTALSQNDIALAVPIYFQNEMRGLICLAEKVTSNDFSDEELDAMQTFANQISLAVENARLVQERLELISRIYQAEKADSLGNLATTMSHEIKNPLSSIKTIIQVLHEKAEGEDKKDLQLVVQEIDRLNSILEKLLSFARPAGDSISQLNVEEIVADVISLLQHQARKNGVELSVKSEPGLPLVIGRVQSVREIVFNIILNALQAQPDGGRIDITLASDLVKEEKTGEQRKVLVLSAEDAGPGIPDDMFEKIYEPFYTSKTVGTGLGLAIVKRNVEEMGGRIIAENRQAGARFTIILPLNNFEQEEILH